MSDKTFFELYGTELVSIGGWLGDARFTVEELYQAFKMRAEAEREARERGAP